MLIILRNVKHCCLIVFFKTTVNKISVIQIKNQFTKTKLTINNSELCSVTLAFNAGIIQLSV